MLHHVASSQHCLTLMAPLMSSAPMAMAAAMIWPPGGGTTACITVVRTPSMARNESLKAARGPPMAPASELTWSVRFITDEGVDAGVRGLRGAAVAVHSGVQVGQRIHWGLASTCV